MIRGYKMLCTKKGKQDRATFCHLPVLLACHNKINIFCVLDSSVCWWCMFCVVHSVASEHGSEATGSGLLRVLLHPSSAHGRSSIRSRYPSQLSWCWGKKKKKGLYYWDINIVRSELDVCSGLLLREQISCADGALRFLTAHLSLFSAKRCIIGTPRCHCSMPAVLWLLFMFFKRILPCLRYVLTSFPNVLQGSVFQTAIYNQTVTITEQEEGLDGETWGFPSTECINGGLNQFLYLSSMQIIHQSQV